MNHFSLKILTFILNISEPNGVLNLELIIKCEMERSLPWFDVFEWGCLNWINWNNLGQAKLLVNILVKVDSQMLATKFSYDLLLIGNYFLLQLIPELSFNRTLIVQIKILKRLWSEKLVLFQT